MTAPAPTRFAPVTPLRVVPPLEEIDLAGAERAAADFLTALGVGHRHRGHGRHPGAGWPGPTPRCSAPARST